MIAFVLIVGLLTPGSADCEYWEPWECIEANQIEMGGGSHEGSVYNNTGLHVARPVPGLHWWQQQPWCWPTELLGSAGGGQSVCVAFGSVEETAPPIVHTPPIRSSHTRARSRTGMGDGGSDVRRWESLVRNYFGSSTSAALKVIACESGGNPDAYNPSGASGLFQIKPFWLEHYGGGSLFDPETNVRVASEIHRDRGWQDWTCKRVL